MDKADIVVIGAGVIGLAVARELSRRSGASVYVLERNRRAGQEISSRNSEVIHSGLYYPHDMLKSRLCIEGRDLLYTYCMENNIPFQKCGKLLIACVPEEHAQLEGLSLQAYKNGISCSWIQKDELERLEPDILACEALLFPESGTIDAHRFIQSLQYEACANGVSIVWQCDVVNARKEGNHYVLETSGGDVKAGTVINSAGLGAVQLAKSLGIDPGEGGFEMHPCKGEYFKVRGRFRINHLIYPVPTDKSLGIHLSFDIERNLRLGPSAEYVSQLDYSVEESNREKFYEAARRYIRDLRLEDLNPDFAGIRPKIQGPGEAMRDFIITDESGRGFPGWINLIGIESPGLTSSLAIARYVADLL